MFPRDEHSPLGQLDEGQAACLVDVAPLANDSGKSHGKRPIRGGRARVREAFYMAALSASRLNPECSVKYKRLLEVGKLPKVALVAVMCKLLVLANAVLRDKRKGTPSAPKREVKTLRV